MLPSLYRCLLWQDVHRRKRTPHHPKKTHCVLSAVPNDSYGGISLPWTKVGNLSPTTHTTYSPQCLVSGPNSTNRVSPIDVCLIFEVKQNLEEILSSKATAKKAKPLITDSVLNLFPHFSKGFYQHPPINYGPNYASSVQG